MDPRTPVYVQARYYDRDVPIGPGTSKTRGSAKSDRIIIGGKGITDITAGTGELLVVALIAAADRDEIRPSPQKVGKRTMRRLLSFHKHTECPSMVIMAKTFFIYRFLCKVQLTAINGQSRNSYSVVNLHIAAIALEREVECRLI